jgi:hypothetical protein
MREPTRLAYTDDPRLRGLKGTWLERSALVAAQARVMADAVIAAGEDAPPNRGLGRTIRSGSAGFRPWEGAARPVAPSSARGQRMPYAISDGAANPQRVAVPRLSKPMTASLLTASCARQVPWKQSRSL